MSREEKEQDRQTLIKTLEANLIHLEKATNEDKLVKFAGDLIADIAEVASPDISAIIRYKRTLPEFRRVYTDLVTDSSNIVEQIEAPGEEQDELPGVIEEYIRNTKDNLEQLIQILKQIPAVKDTSNLIKTEKVPLSKFPPGLSDKIASYLSGKEGSIQTQMAELRRDTRRGGRKTKKNRSRRKKTHGRRV